jgi:ubiquinone/menaquinone biosynthesis C-methylase UbiE
MNPPATFAPRSSTLPLGSRGEIVDVEASGASTAEASVIAANRNFYSQISKKYDRYEACSSDSRLQRMLEKDLDSIQSCFTLLRRTPLCLDCGGGTGNLALKMLDRGGTSQS